MGRLFGGGVYCLWSCTPETLSPNFCFIGTAQAQQSAASALSTPQTRYLIYALIVVTAEIG